MSIASQADLGQPPAPGRFTAVALGLAVLVAASGCARRYDFTPTELARVQTVSGVSPLRVYPSTRIISVYDENITDERYRVQREIAESSRRDTKNVVIDRNANGLILEVAELNGKPLLWVTFDPSCRKVDCAYGFVQTEDERFRLVTVPELEHYKTPHNYRTWRREKRRLQKGKLASLAEANEVWLVKKGNGDLLTIELQVKKVVERRSRSVRQRQRGFD